MKHNTFVKLKRRLNCNYEHFLNQKKNANIEKFAILISLVYHYSGKEIGLIGQDLPFTKACWQHSSVA